MQRMIASARLCPPYDLRVLLVGKIAQRSARMAMLRQAILPTLRHYATDEPAADIHAAARVACMRRRMRTNSRSVRPARFGDQMRNQVLSRRLIGSISACAQSSHTITCS